MLVLLALILITALIMFFSNKNEGFYGGWRYGSYGRYPYFWRNYVGGYPYTWQSRFGKYGRYNRGAYNRGYYPYYNRYSYLPYASWW